MQYPSGSKSSHNFSFSNNDKIIYPFYNFEVEVRSNTETIPSTLYHLNYTGIFLVDAADSLLFISAIEVLHWVFVSKSQSIFPFR